MNKFLLYKRQNQTLNDMIDKLTAEKMEWDAERKQLLKFTRSSCPQPLLQALVEALKQYV